MTIKCRPNFQTPSPKSVYVRYFSPLSLRQRTAHERLRRICFIDYDREMALVAEQTNPQTGESTILTLGQPCWESDWEVAEAAIVVGDAFQGKGLGTELLRRLIEVARAEQIQWVVGLLLADNRTMQRVCDKLGFRVEPMIDDPTVVTVELDV
jgi:acetyltransferase